LPADSPEVNVETLSRQRDSVLSLYRSLIGLRNANAALNRGGVEGVGSDGKVLRYERAVEAQRFSVRLNLGEAAEEAAVDGGHIVASTHMDRHGEAVVSRVSLRPFEGVVVRIGG
jgi:glycosidase